ncbi:hypothetical protein ACJJI5_17970 [Microbulbifer sp. EKSA008]
MSRLPVGPIIVSAGSVEHKILIKYFRTSNCVTTINRKGGTT